MNPSTAPSVGRSRPSANGRPVVGAFRVLLVMVAVSVLVPLFWAVPRVIGLRETWFEQATAWVVLAIAPLVCAAAVRMHLTRRRVLADADLTRWRLSAFIETVDEVLWETTADGTITYAGPKAVELLGYRPDEVRGQHIAAVLAEREISRAMSLLAATAASGHGWTDERYTYVTKDGFEKELYSSALIHLDGDRRPVGFTGTLREPATDAAVGDELERTRERIAAVFGSDALRIVFQPIINLATGAVVGAEALSRFMTDPPRTPDVWFTDAAKVGLGADLELLAVQLAMPAAQHLPADIYLSINVSPATLASGRLPAVLEDACWPSTQLVVEITEHVSVVDYACLTSRIDDLRTMGVRVAVDDAGAGYASFRHILQLRPDYIKLDRTLVDGIDSDPAKRALAGAVVAFGQGVGAIVVAEGVETADELRAARALGIQSAQGFYIGRPLPADPMWGTGLGGVGARPRATTRHERA